MKPIMTTANEPGPALFRALQPPGNGGLWVQIRQNLELAAKLLPLVWSAFLFIGGLNFLFYYGFIDFMPELDLKASITLLATSASIGIVLVIILSAILIGPALSWLGVINNKALKSLWYDESAKFLRRSAILWFILPLASFGVAILLMVAGWQWWSKLSFRVGFPVSLIPILFITGLWVTLRTKLTFTRKQIGERLARQDPNSAQWQTDGVVSYWKLAQSNTVTTADHVDTRALLERGLAILYRLCDESQLTRTQEEWIMQFERALQAPFPPRGMRRLSARGYAWLRRLTSR